MKSLLFVLVSILAGCASAANNAVQVNSTNAVLTSPPGFFESNNVARLTAVNASNAVQDAAIGTKASTNTTDALAATNTAQDAVIALRATITALAATSTADRAYADVVSSNAVVTALTNGVGSGCTVTTTGKTFYVSVVASTGTAASVDADLQDHKTNSAAHSALFAQSNLTNILGELMLTTNSPDGITIIYSGGKISAVAAGVAWGAITGTLTNQTDLNNALNGKYPNSNPSNYCTIFAATNGLSGYVSTNDLRVINSTTNVSGGYLTWANNVISLTQAAISNAMASVYQLAGNYWSKGDAVTNATDSVAVHTNDESYLASLTNFTVSGPASVTRTGRNVALVVSNQTLDMGGYVATGAVGTAAYASSNQFATSNQGAKADTALQAEADPTTTNLLDLAGTRAMTGNSVTLARDVKSRNATSAGVYGVAMGQDTVAAYHGVAMGDGTTAGHHGVAMGSTTTAGDYGAAFNSGSVAGFVGAAFGQTSVSGDYGFSAGYKGKGAAGSFVFSDFVDMVDFDRTAYTNWFSVRASGGTYFKTPDLTVTGTVTATSFNGSGSSLTGVLKPGNTNGWEVGSHAGLISTNGVVRIDAENKRTNTFGGALVIGPVRYQANGGQATANGGWGNFGGSAFGVGSWANYSATASGDGSWANYSSSASGDGSWAGAASIASGLHSWSFGQGATASNDYSFAWAGSHSHGSYTFNISTPNLFYLGNTNLQTFLDAKMNSSGVTTIIYSNPAAFQAAGNYLVSNGVTGVNSLGTGFVNGQATNVGSLTPWTGQGYLTNVTTAQIAAAGGVTNILTAATNLPAGQLVYQGGTLYGGTNDQAGSGAVSYTHLTLPTKRIV